MYIGHYYSTIDKFNRIVIPFEFVSDEVDYFVVNRADAKALMVQAPADARITEKRINRLSIYNSSNRISIRYYYRGKYDLYLDENNRITLPETLLEYMRAGKEVLMIGLLNRIEIWDPDSFEACKPHFYFSSDRLYLTEELGNFTEESFCEYCRQLRSGNFELPEDL